jgi:hypothetical protein
VSTVDTTPTAVFPAVRRFYLTKVFEAKQEQRPSLQAIWQGKQAAIAGTALPATIPHQADLAALAPSYTVLEDLTGSTADELVKVGLSRVKAQAVITALG